MLRSAVFQSFQHAPVGLLEKFNAFKAPSSLIQAVGDGYDLLMYDVIGLGGIEANDVAQALALAGGKPLRVRINSVGGEVFTGWTLHNLLTDYKGEVTVVVDGLAASAACFLAMAADNILMQPESFMMLHCGWCLALGNRFDLATQINALTKIDEAQSRVFAAKTGMSTDQIDILLAAETWLSADEAVAQGFADSIVGDSSSETVDAVLANALDDIFAFDKRKRLLSARLLSRQLSS